MGRSLGVIYLLVIQLYMLLVVHGVELKTWNAYSYCHDRISMDSPAGILRLDIANLPEGGQRECRVIVSPSTLLGDGGNGRVLLYFTQFKFPRPCSDFSVTLLDGSWMNANPVTGPSYPICAANHHSVTEQEPVFYTSGTDFVVVIRWWKTKSRLQISGGFTLKFASFYKGLCAGDYNALTTCVNKRCTSSEFHCHHNISTCGPEEKDACLTDNESGFIELLLQMLEIIAVVVAVMVGCYFLWKFILIRKRRRANGNSQNNERPPSPLLELGHTPNSTEPLNPQDSGGRRPSVDNDDSSAYSSTSSNLTDQMAPPSYNALTPAPSVQPSAPLPPSLPTPPSEPQVSPPSVPPFERASLPPPSYEDFISNEDLYKP